MCFLLIAFIHLLFHAQDSQGVSTSEGMVFLISAPSTTLIHNSHKQYPRLVLNMESGVDCQVRITSEWMTNPDVFVDTVIHLKAFIYTRYFKNYLHFGPESASGLRWTYHLVGTQPFAVLVSIESNEVAIETFTALPVTGWGRRYFAVTLEDKIALVLIANEDETTVNILLRSAERNFRMNISGTNYNSGSNVSLTLMRYQSFALGTCSNGDSAGSVTGTYIAGTKEFGMVSGHCYVITRVAACNSHSRETHDGVSGSLVAEMLLSQETFGKYFLLFKTTGPITTGTYLVVAGEDNTAVSLTSDQQTTVNLAKAGDWTSHDADYMWIECQKPCQVVYFQNSSCLLNGHANNEADPSMLLVTPVELFYFIYFCMVPAVNIHHYLSLMTPVEKGDTLKIKTTPGEQGILGGAIKSVISYPSSAKWGSWEFRAFVLETDSSFVIYSHAMRFGCFMHGQNLSVSYMHSVGFVSSNIQSCDRSAATSNDLSDNDCDGLVDEELQNNKDDDKDQHTDEDFQQTYDNSTMVTQYIQNNPNYKEPVTTPRTTNAPTTRATTTSSTASTTTATTVRSSARPPTTTTSKTRDVDDTLETTRPTTRKPEDFNDYEEWTNWHCGEDCQKPQQLRERPCKKVPVNITRHRCTEPHVEIGDRLCFVNQTCPGKCPMFTYGTNCNRSCLNCEEPCNKFTGVCLSCAPGFTMPKYACTIVCGFNSYGKQCRGNCVEKCGEDCVERINGDCPNSFIKSYFHVFVALLLIPIVIYLYLAIQRATGDEKYSVKGEGMSAMSISEKSRSQKSGTSDKDAKTESSGGTLPGKSPPTSSSALT